MDEKKLADLFNDATRDVPPASFDTDDVRRASRRATIKRRNSIVAGSALAFVLLAGGTVTTIALSGETADTAAVSAPGLGGAPRANSGTMYKEGAEQQPAAPGARSDVPSPQLDTRSELPKQGGSSPGDAGSAGSTPSGCKADWELAAALASELPAAASPTQVPVPFGCPAGARGVALKVTDGGKQGTLSIVLLPAGVEPPRGTLMGGDVDGYSITESRAASGVSVYIVSQPAAGTSEAPFVDDIPRYATEIGKRY